LIHTFIVKGYDVADIGTAANVGQFLQKDKYLSPLFIYIPLNLALYYYDRK